MHSTKRTYHSLQALAKYQDYQRQENDAYAKHATENDINIRHKGNEESDEQYSPPRGLIERLPSDQSTQRPEDTRNSIVPVKDSQENEKTTVTEDLAFAEEHRESMAEMRQKILNTLEVGIQETIGRFVAAARAFGLVISLKKTEVLFQPRPGTRNTQESIMMINNRPHKRVRSFKYLGSTINFKNTLDDETKKKNGKMPLEKDSNVNLIFEIVANSGLKEKKI
ncbi:Hypothetical predicted protein [Octopus vulgaris]|uniref:Uncharacterized protein n=1 Tax=Octopus vulgaris TaxID=6645 RepID=A0AA36B0B8_OCTVU|nr:Hypothetical predicted protein [Octopus vulgaris]